MNTRQELIDHLESQLELSDEMKQQFKETENLREEDMFTSEEALAYLRKIRKNER